MYWECFTAILGGVVGLKGAEHGGADLKWAGHVVGVSLSHLGSKKFTQWYSVVLSGNQYEPPIIQELFYLALFDRSVPL
jgi:hypothetical protein